jgi:Ca-activated chloride channel family protein
VTVTDPDKRLVTGLSERDFEIFEDGVAQRPSFFRREDLPLAVSILIDCSASMDEKLRAAQDAGVRFVRTLRSEDVAQVVQFSERVLTLQDFTSDPQALEAAIRSTRAAGPTALYTAVYVTLRQLQSLGQRSGVLRRAIVLLSDGEDTASPLADEQVLELARRTEIALYAISLAPDRPSDRERIEHGQAVHFLTRLANDSGGEIYTPAATSDLDAVYARVAEELRKQYTLGYVPSNPARDGKWRRILVRMRDGELKVRHKLGYYGPRG